MDDDNANPNAPREPQQPEREEDAGGMEIGDFILVVVGAHLRAEMADRPLAYQLCQRIGDWLQQHNDLLQIDLVPIVCSDIWYVNQETLQQRPTISIGGPGVNALSAYWWTQKKINTAVVQDDKMVIQLDPEFIDLRVSIWGMDHDLTVKALDIFCEKYLADYLKAVATQVEPEVD